MSNLLRFLASGTITLFLIVSLCSLGSTRGSFSIVSSYNEVEANIITQKVAARVDNRGERLEKFLTERNSPLAQEAGTFIEVADNYNLDWTFLPAIAGVESGFGKALLEGSYNPFGWGGGYIYFDSWETGIETVGSELYKRWVIKGGRTPEQLGPTYCPPNWRYWINGVRFYMSEIDNARVLDPESHLR